MVKKIKGISVKAIQKTEPGEGFVWTTCKNCGYAFEGNYCPSCGQSVVEVQKPVHHFFGDIFGSLFALDLRAIRSIPMLLIKPGRLSGEYVEGKRARHVAPFRLYFFASVFFFFLIGWQTKDKIDKIAQQDIHMGDSISEEIPVAIRINTSGDTVFNMNNLSGSLGLIERIQEELGSELSDSSLTEKERLKKQNWIDLLDNPDVVVSKAYQYISWSFFVLMPLFALVLLLVFRKKRKYYVEHLIFSVNLHTFFFIILILTVLLNLIFPSLMAGAGFWVFLFIVIYSVIGIRNFYSTRWISAIFSSLGIFFIYLLSVGVILIGSLVLLFKIS